MLVKKMKAQAEGSDSGQSLTEYQPGHLHEASSP